MHPVGSLLHEKEATFYVKCMFIRSSHLLLKKKNNRPEVNMTGTHIFEECLVLWVRGRSLSTLHALQLLLPWFARTVTDQRRLLHQTPPSFGKWSKGLSLFLHLGYTCTNGATCCGCTTAMRADTVRGCTGLGPCNRSSITKVCLSSLILHTRNVILQDVHWSVAYSGWGPRFGVFNPPPPEIPKALQNCAKLNPIVKTVKNCWIEDANTPRCSEKKAVKF